LRVQETKEKNVSMNRFLRMKRNTSSSRESSRVLVHKRTLLEEHFFAEQYKERSFQRMKEESFFVSLERQMRKHSQMKNKRE
jgi:hypothetical protein